MPENKLYYGDNLDVLRRYLLRSAAQQGHDLLRLVSLDGHNQLSFRWILSFHLVQISPVTSFS